MKRNPACPSYGIHCKIQNRPVSNCVGPIFHFFGFTVWRGNASAVEMVPSDYNRCPYFLIPYKVIEYLSHLCSFTVAKPADSCRQSLKLYFLTCLSNPSCEPFIFWKSFHNIFVRGVNLFRFS